jgi:putative membrane-bound dehydrogenase-like protein
MRFRSLPLAALALTLGLPALVQADIPAIFNTEKTPGGPMPAEEAARTMELPPGFKCQVFAAEPDVQQPIAMAWDPRGRLWIAECYTYAENPDRWNTTLRDRILIFEDSNNDGHFDKRTVFWDQGVRLTSIEIGYGGVYALCAPNLIFIPDKNGDDKPDGDPEVLLDGFNFKTIGHNVVNGLRWGPDGWLYGRHGITDTSNIGAPGAPQDKRTQMNCGIFRYHPTRHVFEAVLHGGTNSWGMDWDANGELFWINTVIGHLFHGIPGSYTDRMFGTHLNKYVYETIQQTADHYHFDQGNEKWADIKKGMSSRTDEMGGGHAHVGCVIYNGGLWPKEYQGKLFTPNLHGHRINMDILEREGNGFVAKHGKDFMKAKDLWFRGIDMSTGPDGNVYLLDWSDAGECHDNDGVHRTSGRIYKISYGEQKKLEPFDLAKMGAVALGEEGTWHASNNWWRRMIDRVRWDKGAPLKAAVEPTIADASSPSGLVRLHLASALQRLPLESSYPIATALAAHAEDANDKQQPLMIWYGIEPAVVPHPDKAIALALSSKIPKVTKLITRRLTEEIEKTPAPIEDLLTAAGQDSNAGARAEIVRGMSEALKGFSQVAKPKAWESFAAKVASNDSIKDQLRDLNLVFGSGRAVDELIALIKQTEGDANARRSAFDSLMRNVKPEHFNLVKGQINDKVLGGVARLGLAKFADADVPKALLTTWPERSQEWRAANVTTLCSRAAWAKELLTFVEKHPAAREDITPYQARQLRNLGDEALTAQLTKVWGELRDTPEAKKQELAKWQTLLTKDALTKGDAAKGRLLFSGVCASCHKLYGSGAAIGPDLTGSDRHNLDYLLGNIIDPNAVVPADYRVSVIKLKDGRTLTGVIPEQTDKVLTVQTPAERVSLQRSDVAEMQQLSQSLMPEGLLTALGEENVRHLIAYLMSSGQVPLPQ